MRWRLHSRRAGELTQEEVERLVTIIQNPRQFKVPDWMLNRKKDVKDGKFSQVVSNTLDMKLREDLERLKKIRAHRGLRHYCAPPPPTGEHGTEGGWPAAGRACSSGGGSAASSLLGHQAVCGSPSRPSPRPCPSFLAGGLRVRGQRTKTTGRKGRTVGVSKKKG